MIRILALLMLFAIPASAQVPLGPLGSTGVTQGPIGPTGGGGSTQSSPYLIYNTQGYILYNSPAGSQLRCNAC